jgi:uncharacterized protein YjbJ (UPF0337 family)
MPLEPKAKENRKNGKASDVASGVSSGDVEDAANFKDDGAATAADSEESGRLSEFSKTSTAAKMSGKFHATSGFIKRKVGEFTDDANLKNSGLNQEVLGKVHSFVGLIRETRERANEKISKKRDEGMALLQKHGIKLIDVAHDFVTDVKNLLLK